MPDILICVFNRKFFLDEGTVILFSGKDQKMLHAESENYVRIKNGLESNNVRLSFLQGEKSTGFYFDMGYQGKISIDKDLFESLANVLAYKKQLSCRTLERIDTTYVINAVDVELDGIQVPNCTLRYYPIVNRNLIGAGFIGRFNFILGYCQTESGGRSADLFIQPSSKNFFSTSTTDTSNLGFDINPLNGNLLITSLEIGGKAENAGLRVKDSVVEINNGVIDLSIKSVLSGQVANYLSHNQNMTIKVRRNDEIIEYTIK